MMAMMMMMMMMMMMIMMMMLKNINFNYRRSEEPTKTLWQADMDFINLKQHKSNLTTYFEKFKATKKVFEELNQTINGHVVVEIPCKEQSSSVDGLEPAEATKFIANGKERIFGMQLIMNTDRDKYGTLIKDYDNKYFGVINKYPKILQDV